MTCFPSGRISLRHGRKKYRYILIDEFQDINLIQWKIMWDACRTGK